MTRRYGALLVVAVLPMLSCDSDESGTARPPPNVFATYSQPSWHPSGRTIYFNHTPLKRYYKDPFTGRFTYVYDESLSGAWAVSSDGTDLRRVLDITLSEVDWDPSGGVLAFSSGGSLYTLAGSDSELSAGSPSLLATDENAFAPSWSPDGARLLFSVHTGSESGIYMVPATGGGSHRVGNPGWRHPDWSPDGARMVFIDQESTTLSVAVADTSGNNYRALWTNAGSHLGYARWSPDGTTIAFTGRRNDSESIELWVVNVNGQNAHPITSGGVLDAFAWSPSGAEIVYTRFNRFDPSLQNGTLWAVNVASGAIRQIANN